jgi:hypothetical protein
MNTKDLSKSKWTWIIGGIVVLLILVSIGGEKVKPIEISRGQQAKVLFPIKELINKTPSEIETIIGAKMENLGKGTGGKTMNADIELKGANIETAYTLIEHPKVKYNGTFLFNIWFEKPVNEDEAWSMVGLLKPTKKDALQSKYMSKGCSEELFLNNKCNKFIWTNMPPFAQLEAGYIDGKIEFIECSLLPEEDMSLYPIE